MPIIADARNPGKDALPVAGLPLFDWHPAPHLRPANLQHAARRLAARCRVPFHVALAHAEAAGLGMSKEAH